MQAWFYEHIRFRKFEKSNGCIPRYNNWKFTASSKRKFLAKHLSEVSISGIIPGPLIPTDQEREIVGTGFAANEHLSVINDERAICRYSAKNLSLLLIQMAPVYKVFNLPVCDYLLGQANDKRFEELNYSVKNKNSIEENSSPNFLQRMCDEVSKVEKQFGVHRTQKKNQEINEGGTHFNLITYQIKNI
jgi:hypothetical protein